MSIGEIPVLALLKSKMKWHQARQKVLAENVANANTPGYKPLELGKMRVDVPGGSVSPFGVKLARTSTGHMTAPGGSGASKFETVKSQGWEISPSGNAVVLEEQMMKITENQMDYQTATTLYGRSLAILRTAIGK